MYVHTYALLHTSGTLVGSALCLLIKALTVAPRLVITAAVNGVFPRYNRTQFTMNNFIELISYNIYVV